MAHIGSERGSLFMSQSPPPFLSELPRDLSEHRIAVKEDRNAIELVNSSQDHACARHGIANPRTPCVQSKIGTSQSTLTVDWKTRF